MRRPSPSRRPCRRSPRSLLLLLPPSAFPRDPDLSLLLLRVEEEARAPLPPSPRKGDVGPCGALLLCAAVVVAIVLRVVVFHVIESVIVDVLAVMCQQTTGQAR